jgi:hypothetical protein
MSIRDSSKSCQNIHSTEQMPNREEAVLKCFDTGLRM